jgi:hypothetical protein
MSKIKMIFLGLLDREKVRERETGGGAKYWLFFLRFIYPLVLALLGTWKAKKGTVRAYG